MNREEHIKRHEELHKALDELVANCIRDKKDFLPSKASVMDLMQWSHEQTISPTEAE